MWLLLIKNQQIAFQIKNSIQSSNSQIDIRIHLFFAIELKLLFKNELDYRTQSKSNNHQRRTN